MKEQHPKTAVFDETKTLETIPITELPDGEETQRLRSLTVQEIEQILKDER